MNNLLRNVTYHIYSSLKLGYGYIFGAVILSPSNQEKGEEHNEDKKGIWTPQTLAYAYNGIFTQVRKTAVARKKI